MLWLLAQTPVDPREWMQWALDRGVNGVLMLACFVLFSIVVRLHKEKNKQHEARATLEEDYRRQLLAASEAYRKHAEELEEAFRAKVEQLLREQVKFAKETTATLVEATSVLKSLHARLDEQEFAGGGPHGGST
jgi:transketolase